MKLVVGITMVSGNRRSMPPPYNRQRLIMAANNCCNYRRTVEQVHPQQVSAGENSGGLWEFLSEFIRFHNPPLFFRRRAVDFFILGKLLRRENANR